MKMIQFLIVIFLGAIISTPASAQELSFKPNEQADAIKDLFNEDQLYDSTELLIGFKQSTTITQRRDILKAFSLSEKDYQEQGSINLVRVPRGQDLEKIANQLVQYKEVNYVEPNLQLQGSSIPSDSYYSKQWGAKKINLPEAWDTTTGESSIVVAVVDSGVDTNHSEFKGKIIKSYDISTGKKSIIGTSHGTHVAGIIGAAMDKKGVVGTAPNISLMPINIFKGSEASVFNFIQGIQYAVDNGVDIINLSLYTSYYSATMDTAIQYAHSKGVLVVSAVGNDGKIMTAYPAALENVIAVSATNQDDSFAKFSNRGEYVDISAPGTDIISTDTDGMYSTMTGTSMATPFISGVSALILSKNPYLSADEVESILIKSSKDLGIKGKDNYFGYGRVDAAAALKQTPSLVKNLKISTSNLQQNGKNTVDASFNVEEGRKVSIYITDKKGKTIKNLITNQISNGELIQISWNGLNNDGAYNYSSQVTIKIKVTDGSKTSYENKNVTITDTLHPYLKNTSSSFIINPKKKLSIPFTLSKRASIKADIYQSNAKKIRNWTTQKSSGDNSISWDGKNNSKKQVSDGKYTINMTPVDPDGYEGLTQKVNVIVDTKAPSLTVKSASKTFNIRKQSKINATLTLKETANVNVSIVDKNGKTVKMIFKNKSLRKGTVTWDGKKFNKIITAVGTYYFKVTAMDKAGNTSVKKVSFKMTK